MKIVIILLSVVPILCGIVALVWYLFLRDWLAGGECLICDGRCKYEHHENDPDNPCSYNFPPDIF